jgi:NADH-quinone oxidoreductase subunit N
MSIIEQLVSAVGLPNFNVLLPEIIVLITAFIVFFEELFVKNRILISATTVIGLLISGISIFTIKQGDITLYGLYIVDGFSLLFKLFLIIATIIIIATYRRYFESKDIYFGEFYYLTLFALLGMMIMVSSPNLFTFYVGLELSSITTYILVGMFKTKNQKFKEEDYKSKEASFKYLIIGGAGTAIISYAIALLYGTTGTFDFIEIAQSTTESLNIGIIAGMVLLITGLALKAAAVPFHHWAPDAYEGAPTPITTFMAVTVKVATFALILRVMVEAFPFVSKDWAILWAILAAASMIVGNFIALRQKSIKRMLAYSSIAHTGYITAALAAPTGMGFAAFIFYSLVYIFMSIGAFAVLTILEKSEGWNNTFEDFKGLARKSPLVALVMLIFMFSLLGIPPTVGFFGKLGIFLALIGSDIWWLAVVLVIMSIISAGYYLRVVSVMYMYEPVKEFSFKINKVEKSVIVLMAVIVLILGIYPTLFWGISTQISSLLIAGIGR